VPFHDFPERALLGFVTVKEDQMLHEVFVQPPTNHLKLFYAVQTLLDFNFLFKPFKHFDVFVQLRLCIELFVAVITWKLNFSVNRIWLLLLLLLWWWWMKLLTKVIMISLLLIMLSMLLLFLLELLRFADFNQITEFICFHLCN